MHFLVICKFKKDQINSNLETSSPKGNNRLPEGQQVIKNSSQVKDFSDGQGQVTPQSMVGSGRNSNSSETL